MSVKINTVTAYATDTTIAISIKMPKMGVRNIAMDPNENFAAAASKAMLAVCDVVNRYADLCHGKGIMVDTNLSMRCVDAVTKFMLNEVLCDARDASGIDSSELCKMELYKVVGWYHTAQWNK